jgi:lipopolysaccharide/colanic/teichoic acid biosynthesis glycosyltransferase
VYKKFGKRLFDIIISIIGLILLSPLMISLFIVLRVSSKERVFFIQKRVGKNFIEFNLYKFRSMTTTSSNGLLVTSAGDNRITRIGKIIRKTKIDELPQLLNVLKGDMSIVGPRPEVMTFVKHKKDIYKKILTIRPGITDHASILFRNEEEILKGFKDKHKGYIDTIMPRKIELYCNYVDDITISNDIKLILKTLKAIFDKANR